MLKFILRNNKCRIIAAIILLLMFIPVGSSYADGVMSQNEELFYEVSFLGINLGSIKIITEGNDIINGVNAYKAKAFIDSYQGIPFVDLHTIYESWIDPTVTFSHQFVGHTKIENDWDYQFIGFDYKKGLIKTEKWFRKNKEFDLSFKTTKKWNEGLSLFFLARKYINLKRLIKIPTYLDRDTASTEINFTGKQESVSIDAVPYPVKCLYFSGQAFWKGIYGLSGKFEGWFSTDEAHIPIKAKMNVYVGSVLIELKSWKRNGWSPPK